MRCLPESSDKVLFQKAVERFDVGDYVPPSDDPLYLRTQSILGRQFSEAYRVAPSSFSLPELERGYQRVFALYWEMRMGKG